MTGIFHGQNKNKACSQTTSNMTNHNAARCHREPHKTSHTRNDKHQNTQKTEKVWPVGRFNPHRDWIRLAESPSFMPLIGINMPFVF